MGSQSLEAIFNACQNINLENLSPHAAFKTFYNECNLILLDGWLATVIHKTPKKSDTEAETLRKTGNEHYAKDNHSEAIEFYTRSMLFATYNGIEYGKAAANRSAVFFTQDNYEECLKDISYCLTSAYPNELRAKLYIRQLKCYYKLNMQNEFNMAIGDHYESLNDNGNFLEIKLLYNGNRAMNSRLNEKEEKFAINETFAYATDLVKLAHSPEKGRHVLAATDLKPGDVLFKEEAFITGTAFSTPYQLIAPVCYHCLIDLPFSSLPCETCTFCLYCSETCRRVSWRTYHRFECPGMAIFYHLGQGLPALKFLLKGLNVKFVSDANVEQFGAYINNYPYASSLNDHFQLRGDKLQDCLVAAVLLKYLATYTDFSVYYDAYYEKFELSPSEFLGGLLVKHMAQLFCNGSIIERNGVQLAAGIYPSISMMNHSCKCNIMIEYVGNWAIVKAKVPIKKGEEICNNYGVASSWDRDARREHLRDNFCFNCTCSVCAI